MIPQMLIADYCKSPLFTMEIILKGCVWNKLVFLSQEHQVTRELVETREVGDFGDSQFLLCLVILISCLIQHLYFITFHLYRNVYAN